jgi:carbonic anhydrase
LSGWCKSYRGNFNNNGHSIQFNPKKKKATLTTSTGTYSVQQFHLHWGRNDSEGSEHQIEGKKFSAEMHFVTKKKREKDDSASDYYSVLAVLFEADPTVSMSTKPWKKIDLGNLTETGASVKGRIKFEDFLPSNLSYYHYEGSLTTPGCNEIVQWYVLQTPVKIPTAFLKQLRQLKNNRQHPISFNFRDPQPINGRIIMACRTQQ